MSHSLSKQELKDVLSISSSPGSSGVRWLELARDWQEELVMLDYLFAQVLEGEDNSTERGRIIGQYFAFEEAHWSTREDFGLVFVEYMLRHLRDRDLSLEEELLYLRDRMAHHEYDHTLRF